MWKLFFLNIDTSATKTVDKKNIDVEESFWSRRVTFLYSGMVNIERTIAHVHDN